jgi:phosphatidylserine decarboxylase
VSLNRVNNHYPTSSAFPDHHQHTSAPWPASLMPSSDAEDSSGSRSDSRSGTEETFERAVDVKDCSLFHRPCLSKKAEVGLLMHLAVYANSDWAKIDRIMVENFITASHAQSRWFMKFISMVSSRDYRLGGTFLFCLVRGTGAGCNG